jgi:hypothetical protein
MTYQSVRSGPGHVQTTLFELNPMFGMSWTWGPRVHGEYSPRTWGPRVHGEYGHRVPMSMGGILMLEVPPNVMVSAPKVIGEDSQRHRE